MLDLRAFWGVLNKHRFLLLFTVLAIESIVALSLIRTPPEYPAWAKVIIQDDASRVLASPDPLGFGYMYSEEFFQTQYRRLNSRPVIERAIKSEKMDEWPEFQGIEDLANEISLGISLNPIRESRLVEVLYEGPDPEHAAILVNAVVNSFEEEFNATRLRQAEGNASSLTGSIDKIENEMRGYERQIQDFMAVHGLVTINPDVHPANIQLKELARREANLHADLLELEARSERLVKDSKNPEELLNLEASDLQYRFSRYDEVYVQLLAKRIELQHLKDKESPELKVVEEQIESVQAGQRRLANQIIESVLYKLHHTRRALESMRKEKALLEKEVQKLNETLVAYERLKSRLKESQDRFQELLTGRARGEVYGRMNVAPVLIVERPVVARSPSKPRVLRSLALGLILSLLLGAGMSLILEFFDDSIRSAEEVEAFTGVPCLSIVPKMDATVSEDERMALVLTQPESNVAEAFRGLRATLDLQVPPPAEGGRLFMITSAQPGEGKTTISSNLAIAHAQNGRRTLLIAGDLRKGCDLTALGVPAGSKGLMDYLTGEMPAQEAVTACKVDSLDVVAAGVAQGSPAELLGNKRMLEFLKWARKHYEVVLLDSPPLLAVADALILSPHIDHALAIVHAGRTGRGQVTRASLVLQQNRVPVVGAILNDRTGYVERGSRGYPYPYEAYPYRK